MILSTGGGVLEGGSGPRGCLVPGGAWWRPPPGRPLLRAVRILLECILVLKHGYLCIIHFAASNTTVLITAEEFQSVLTPFYTGYLTKMNVTHAVQLHLKHKMFFFNLCLLFVTVFQLTNHKLQTHSFRSTGKKRW